MVDGQPGEGIKEGKQLIESITINIDVHEVCLPYLIRTFRFRISRQWLWSLYPLLPLPDPALSLENVVDGLW